MSNIFQPFRLRGMTVNNRIAMSPMLMYLAGDNGMLTDLHFVHYGARALSGLGLIMTEVIAVEPAGRISHRDLGIWSDDQAAGLRRLTDFVHATGGKIGVQLAHAGRKAVLEQPIFGPSEIAYDGQSKQPVKLDTDGIAAIVEAYRRATVRAEAAGFDCIEIHAAHGYLLHSFLAPIANRRTDEYGGSLENRARFTLEVTRAVREAWPQEKPLIVRMSATDLIDGGVTQEESLWLAKQLKAVGVDMIEASSGNIVPGYPAPITPGYQVEYAKTIRRTVDIPTAAVGSITSSELAESIVSSGAADIVFMGRELLRNPFWLINAARAANVTLELPIQTYARATSPYERGF
ncbi:NADH:flavin oxidoreductase/NADH oxidase [Paraburkholderia sp. J67]|uniref:NADH:flavin oxidoreductase/NADH oxidase n=1 Tax=Paraburkholderia sp. J67 TaxID=2805435 RepID=UPI002ABE1F94|nr:NADH:flavin oxidoreductase/NADH oxidase [Paraburkholderia sp. J67]